MTPAPPPLPQPIASFSPPPVPPPQKKSAMRWLVPLVLLGLPAMCLIFGGIAVAARKGSVPDNAVLKISLEGVLKDRAAQDGFGELLGKVPMSFEDHIFNLRKAAQDKRIKGVLLRLDYPMYGWAHAEELRDALTDFKKSGKFVVAYAEFYDEKSYSVALAADEIYASPDAPFEFNGLAQDVMHYPGLLEKLGIQVQYFRYGKYKSVSGQTLGLKALTEPVKEMINHDLDVEYDLFLKAVAEHRKLSEDEVKKLIESNGMRAEWAKDNKLIDGLAYIDEVEANLKKRLDVKDADKLPSVSDKKYRHVSPNEAGMKRGKSTFALIHSQGLVVAGKGGVDPFSGDESQGSTPIIKALKRAAEDEEVKAVIFRVDSPGGAGLGCDLVRREIERTVKKKPVIVSMADYAASGGYWVSMDASAIVAEPSTYTGSIGIWSVVPNLKGTYEKLDLNAEVFTRGSHADEINGSRPLSEEESKTFDDALHASYTRFVELAAQGRHKTHDEMETIAQGRTWLGVDAIKNGLIDKLGGLQVAINVGKEKTGIKEDEPVKVLDYEEKKTMLQQILEPDDEDDDTTVNAALSLAAEKSGLRKVLAPASGLSAVAHVILERRETLMLVPEYRVDVH
jgi:protease-4